jgi:AmpD protein
MLTIDPSSGLLQPALFRASPNCDARPKDTVIDLLVIHGISLPPAEFGGNAIEALFLNYLDSNAHPYFQQISHLRVSAHMLIRRDGQLIQYVPFTQRAWHAGISQFAGREQCNDFSIGIELEGTDDIPYATCQYQQLAKLTHLLMQVYPGIQPNSIVGHSDVAPDRKTDPGPAFDWVYYRHLLAKET